MLVRTHVITTIAMLTVVASSVVLPYSASASAAALTSTGPIIKFPIGSCKNCGLGTCETDIFTYESDGTCIEEVVHANGSVTTSSESSTKQGCQDEHNGVCNQ
jgi:hypothetical protein